MANYLDENFDRVRTNPARDIENSQTLKAMQEREAKSTQAVLQGAAGSMLDPNTQKCERQAPAGYEAEKKALLADLESRQKMVAREFKQYEDGARASRDHYDRIQRAILIVGNFPHFELLSELLKLRVL